MGRTHNHFTQASSRDGKAKMIAQSLTLIRIITNDEGQMPGQDQGQEKCGKLRRLPIAPHRVCRMQ